MLPACIEGRRSSCVREWSRLTPVVFSLVWTHDYITEAKLDFYSAMATSKTFTWLVDPAGASNYSHSTIYTTDTSSRGTQDIAPLTSYWTAPSQCVDRWISAFPFVAQAKTNSAQGSGMLACLKRTDIAADFRLVTAGSSNPLQYTFVGFSTNPTNTILPRFPATDPLYISCLPYGSPNHYSPGICPDGQTVAEVTEFHLTMTSNIVETHFQGSCCRE